MTPDERHIRSVEYGSDFSAPPSEPLVDVVIKPAGLRDALRLRSVDVTLRLNQPESLLASPLLIRKPAELLTRPKERKPTTLVAESGGELLGFAEFQPSMPDLRWLLCAVGLQHAATDPIPVWLPLFEDATRRAGASGVKRLFARAPVDSPVSHALRQAGYTPYARERIFSSSHAVAATSGIVIREQERTDTWAVHQLYIASVPREVQYAEAYTSHRWELSEGRSISNGDVRAWLHEMNDTPIVYARSESARRRHVFDVIFPPGSAEIAAQVLDSVISRGSHVSTGGEIFLAVRTYNTELEQHLIERKFALRMEQDLFVRYTTAPLRVVTSETILQEIDAHERSPRGVPAFFVDGSANGKSQFVISGIKHRQPPAG
ncbi:MAG: hypothetical protein AB7G88_07075 [Thermomicrobiales bacterium]